MTAVYVFCAAVGVPLLLWFAFIGDSDGLGDLGDLGGDLGDLGGDAGGHGGPLTVIPLSTVAFLIAFFGVTGLVAGWAGASATTAFVVAAVVAVVAGGLNSAAFGWLRRNSVSTELPPSRFEGRFARVTVPVGSDRRGRIVVEVDGAPVALTARLVDDDDLGVGERAIIVGFEGAVALVVRAAPELDGPEPG